MSSRITLLLITQSQLARIDVTGGKSPRAKEVWTRDRIPGESIATLVDAAIRLGPKRIGNVWVFANDFWTGVIHLAGDVAAALDSDELDQAIALEAETFSGVSAFESRLGLKSLPKDPSGEARWWVTQIPHRDWQEVGQVVQQFRGKLAGMGHAALAAIPAELKVDTNDFDRRHWRLNQAFGESTISIHGVGDEINDVVTFGDLKTQRTQSQLLEWCDQTDRPELDQAWVADRHLPSELCEDTCHRVFLTADNPIEADVGGVAEAFRETGSEIIGDSAFQTWAKAMAACVQTERSVRTPVAIARKPPMSSQTATIVACGLGLLVALACFAVHTATGKQLVDLNSQIDRFNRTKKALATDTQSLKALKKDLSQKQDALGRLQTSNLELASNLTEAKRIRQFQRNRWVKLVSALARANESDCWVSALKTEGDVVKVRGMAVSNKDVSDFTTNLEKYASPHGWRVHPAQTERNEMALVEFEVSLDVSDQVAPDPHGGSSLARSSSNVSLIGAPIQNTSAGAKR